MEPGFPKEQITTKKKIIVNPAFQGTVAQNGATNTTAQRSEYRDKSDNAQAMTWMKQIQKFAVSRTDSKLRHSDSGKLAHRGPGSKD